MCGVRGVCCTTVVSYSEHGMEAEEGQQHAACRPSPFERIHGAGEQQRRLYHRVKLFVVSCEF